MTYDMKRDALLNRRQALLLGGTAAAGLAVGGLTRFAQAAPVIPLPLPRLIEARNSEPVTLTMQTARHAFDAGSAVATMGISADYLGPVVRVRTGETFAFRVENKLKEETTLHWHGLLVPSEVDGGPHNTIAPGGVWTPELSIKQPAATTWFHPHPHGNTAPQIYGGLAGMMIVSDGGDAERGLPHSYGLDDLPLVLQDKRFARNGELSYRPDMMDIMHGFQGDTLIVNGAIRPLAKVPAGFVRLRLLNTANARTFDLAFSDGRSFFVIAGDGGYLAEPVEVKRLLIAVAERYEILVNFADGRAVDLVTGPNPDEGMMMGMRNSRSGGRETFMRFEPAPDLSSQVTRRPRQLAVLDQPDPSIAATRRRFTLDGMMGMGMGGRGRGTGMSHMMGINGRSYAMDRIDFTARLGTSEIWEVFAPDMAHPFHVHGARFRVLSNDGRKPLATQSGWKDVVRVVDRAELLVYFENPAPVKMPLMYHCHILEHEDNGMMGQFAVA